MKTLCKGCIFAVLENEIQTGCKLSKLEKYKEKGLATLVDGNYEIESFCKTVRSEVWAAKVDGSLEDAVNKEAQNKYDYANREKLVIKYTVEKYKTLFPKANVTVGKDYVKNYRNDYKEFPIVIVGFENGSYISFKLGYENDKEYTHKKFDAVAAQLSAIELLNVFNNQ